MNGMKRHRRFALDRDTAERMLAGLSADDAPPNFAAVATLLAAAAAVDETTAPGERAALRAYRDAIYARATMRAPRRVHPWRTAAGRVAVFATASALAIGGGVAAAATGSLPAPAQRVAHSILGGLGVPPVTSQAGPGDFVRPSMSLETTTTPVVTRSPLPSSTEPPASPVVVAVEKSTPATTPTVTTHLPVATNPGKGEAALSVARSTDPGPGHGAAVCFVVTEGVCLTGDKAGPAENDKKGNASAKGHRHDDGAADSARGDKKANGPAKSHRPDRGAADSARGDRNGHAAANGSQYGSNGKDFAQGHQKNNDGTGPAKGHQNDKGTSNRARNGR